MADPMPRSLRSDAKRNRDRVLEAARELFAEHGLDVPMREVARAAGVGPATLYRRFPTKQVLVLEAFMDELNACRTIVRRAAREPDPWRAFCGVIERITVLNARNQAFTAAFLSAFPGAVDFAAHRAEMLEEIAAIARRAKRAGRLREDFELDDFVLVLLAGRGIAATDPRERAAAARRFAALVIAGFRADPEAEALPRGGRLTRAVLGPDVRLRG
jgi:AcrR family transcriptional regulator